MGIFFLYISPSSHLRYSTVVHTPKTSFICTCRLTTVFFFVAAAFLVWLIPLDHLLSLRKKNGKLVVPWEALVFPGLRLLIVLLDDKGIGFIIWLMLALWSVCASSPSTQKRENR